MFIAKSKRLALFILAVTLLAMLSCAAFNVIELDHDCSGKDCSVCLCITICEIILRHSSYVSNVNLYVCSEIFACLILFACVSNFTLRVTLITLKVKLSD